MLSACSSGVSIESVEPATSDATAPSPPRILSYPPAPATTSSSTGAPSTTTTTEAPVDTAGSYGDLEDEELTSDLLVDFTGGTPYEVVTTDEASRDVVSVCDAVRREDGVRLAVDAVGEILQERIDGLNSPATEQQTIRYVEFLMARASSGVCPDAADQIDELRELFSP